MSKGQSGPLAGALTGMLFYVVISLLVEPGILRLYPIESDILFASAHFNDARQYALICAQGYHVPFTISPAVQASNLNWMPVYALLQCALSRGLGISLVYTGVIVSTMAIGAALFFAALTLRQMGIAMPTLHAFAVLIPPVGAAWLYLPGAEAVFLAVGMVALWLVTLPTTDKGYYRQLLRVTAGLAVGVVWVLTKPNALMMLPALAFAFVYQGWRASASAGYAYGLWHYAADVVIEHLPIRVTPRPVRYAWTPAALAVGILLGLAYWLAYSSHMSGIPFYFWIQQTSPLIWGRAWPGGNLPEMLRYVGQAFGPLWEGRLTPWATASAWNTAAILSGVLPMFSRRVPTLIRAMLPLSMVMILYSGAAHGSDRYTLSTSISAIGWACWLAGAAEGPDRGLRSALRWAILIAAAVITSLALLNILLPRGEPQAWGVVE